MRVFLAIREILTSVSFAVAIVIIAVGASAQGQQIQFGFMGRPAQVELTAPHVEEVSGATTSRLEQARALVASRSWEDAVEIYRELAAEKTDRVVAVDGSRYVSLRTYCHLQLGRLPAAGLAAYRRRVDAAAEQLYRNGIAERHERILQRVVDESYCSSWGDDALLALGELALERGDYGAARRNWEQVSPLLRAPDGVPIWLALSEIDLNAKWPEVERLLQKRAEPADWLAYPDTKLELADVRARLALVSIRAGDLDRAAFEVQMLRRMHPQSIGELGGLRENYVGTLERLLAAAREWQPRPGTLDWPTFAGSHSRSKIAAPIGKDLVPIWKEPIEISPPEFSRRVRLVQGGVGADTVIRDQPQLTSRESQRPLSCYPAVVGSAIVFADGAGIRSADVATGKPAITADGILRRKEPAEGEANQAAYNATGGIAHGVPRLSLDVVDRVVYARVGPFVTSHLRAENSSYDDRVVGLDLRREGLLTFQTPREEPSWAVDGAPVCDGNRVYVAMRQSDVTPRAYVACFDATSGVRLWKTAVGAADTPAGGEGDEITHNLLTLVEDRIYFNTNLGLVAALDADSGNICWISRYERYKGKISTVGSAAPLHFDRDPSPCVYHDGLVIVAPSDAAAIFALDADTGKIVWQQSQLPDALHLLGVVGKRLIVSGDRVSSLSVLSGDVHWSWPESDRAGIRGMGRGVIAGNEIFWPTRNQIYVVGPNSGAQTRSPIDLAPLIGGANLAAAEGRLIVAGYDKLFVLAPVQVLEPKTAERANAATAP